MNVYHDVLRRLSDFIEEHLDQDLTVKEVAKKVNYSEQHLNQIFKGYLSIKVGEYIQERKLSKASEELLKNNKVSYVARKYGYTAEGFSNAFKKKFGMSPKKFAQKGGDINTFEKIDIEKISVYEDRINQSLKKLASLNIFNFKKREYSGEFTIFNIDFGKAYKLLSEIINIPIPFELIEKVRIVTESEEEFKETLKSVLAISYLEYADCQRDVSKMKWSMKIPDDVEKVESAYELIEQLCDFEEVNIDNNLIIWFGIKKEVFGLKRNKDYYLEKYNYELNKEEMGVLIESCGEDFLIPYGIAKQDGIPNMEEMHFAFNSDKFIQYINDIGFEVKIPKDMIDKIDSNDTKALLISINKNRLKCLSKGINNFKVTHEEIAIKMFIVSKYYNLTKPMVNGGNYIYKFDDELFAILESISELKQVFSDDPSMDLKGLSYLVTKEGDRFKFELDDLFVSTLLASNSNVDI